MQRGLTQPFLGQPEIAAPQQEAPVPLRAHPLLRPDGQAGMSIPPADVFLQRCDHVGEPSLGIVARAKEDPIRFQQAVGEIPAVGIANNHRNDELVVLSRRLEFVPALFGDHRFWGKNEDERLRRFDSADYPFRPVGGWFNVRPVHPDVHAPRCQRLLELVDKRRIRGNAPVGDEGIVPRLAGRRIIFSHRATGLR